jgi:hypothetical protein
MMTLLCLIGGALREIGPSPLWMQVFLIGAISPQFGLLLRTWIDLQERFPVVTSVGDDEDDDDEEYADEDDGNEEDDDSGSGWLSQNGPIWYWRHVTRLGSVIVVPFVLIAYYDKPEFSVPGRVRAGTRQQTARAKTLFFRSDLA